MRITLAQLDPVVGDIDGNTERIDETLLRLHPGAAPVTGLERIDQDTARGILLASGHGTER